MSAQHSQQCAEHALRLAGLDDDLVAHVMVELLIRRHGPIDSPELDPADEAVLRCWLTRESTNIESRS